MEESSAYKIFKLLSKRLFERIKCILDFGYL